MIFIISASLVIVFERRHRTVGKDVEGQDKRVLRMEKSRTRVCYLREASLRANFVSRILSFKNSASFRALATRSLNSEFMMMTVWRGRRGTLQNDIKRSSVGSGEDEGGCELVGR